MLCQDVALRWYSDTKSIILSGKLAKEFEEKLNSMASISQDLANDKDMPPAHPANNYSIQDDQMLSPEALQSQIQTLTKEVNGNKAALESIRELRMKSSPVLIQESKNETDCLKEKIYQLMDENKHLKSEKSDLTEIINNLSYMHIS